MNSILLICCLVWITTIILFINFRSPARRKKFVCWFWGHDYRKWRFGGRCCKCYNTWKGIEYKVGDLVKVVQQYNGFKFDTILSIKEIDKLEDTTTGTLYYFKGTNWWLYQHHFTPMILSCSCGTRVCDNCKQFRRN